jgi:hypothetical protein
MGLCHGAQPQNLPTAGPPSDSRPPAIDLLAALAHCIIPRPGMEDACDPVSAEDKDLTEDHLQMRVTD